MNLFSPAEVIQNYADAGGRKASLPLFRMLALGILAGMLIAMGSAAVNTAACAIENPLDRPADQRPPLSVWAGDGGPFRSGAFYWKLSALHFGL